MGQCDDRANGASGRVRRRRVLYVPGFDPMGPRRYRELYRREGRVQAALSGYAVEMDGCPDSGGARWRVSTEIDGHQTEAKFEVLDWSDLAQKAMAGGALASYGRLARTLWIYLRTGALFRLIGVRKGPAIAALYPVAVLLAQVALALLVAVALGRASVALGAPGPEALWTLAALLAVPPILTWFHRHDGPVLAHYLMAEFAHGAQGRGAYPPELDARLSTFTARITDACADREADEVLVVGHSSGAPLALSALADGMRRVPPGGRPALALLTLGQAIPKVALLPKADRLRADLRSLSTADNVTWVDITAPGDGACLALCDPVALAGVAGPGQRWPLVLSCAFSQTLAPATWAALRWRFHRLHFQYLCAFDGVDRVNRAPDVYDYFQITAGPQTLAARYSARRPSPGRITRSLLPKGCAVATAEERPSAPIEEAHGAPKQAKAAPGVAP